MPFPLIASDSLATVGDALARREQRAKSTFGVALGVWRARREFRSDLRRLLDTGSHLIADIGLTVDQVRDETALPFWRAELKRPDVRDRTASVRPS